MSRMIDSLGDVARAAGANAADSLSTQSSIDSMEARIRGGVRRRRRRMGALAAVAAVVVGVGVVATPHLLADAPPAPAAPVEPVGPEVVRTENALTVYADGAMSVVTSRGDVVDIAPPQPSDAPYVVPTKEQMCTMEPEAMDLGWTYATPGARELLGHGRPVYIDDAGARHTVVQGQMVPPAKYGSLAPLAFTLESDPAVAPNLAFRASEAGQWEGMPQTSVGLLDGAPRLGESGSAADGTRVATLQMRPLSGLVQNWCTALEPPEVDGVVLTRYLVVDVFLIDHSGSSRLLATHVSWTGTEIHS